MPEERTVTQRLFSALVERGLVTADQISHAQELHVQTRQPLGEVLVARGLVTPTDVRDVLENDLGVPHLDLASYAPEPAALRLVPAEVARTNRILPLFEIEGMLTVAVANPMDVFSFDQLSAQLAYELEPVLSEPSAIAEAVEAGYGGVSAPAPSLAEEEVAAADIADAATDAGAQAGVVAPAEPAPSVGTPSATMEQPVSPDAAPVEAPPAAPGEAAPGEAAPGEAAPAIDLDVLAVADPTRAVLLVTDIITAARDARASHVHVDPAGPEFELHFRVGTERRFVAKAAVSLEGSLSRTIRSMAHMTAEPGRPATGHMRLFVRDEEITVGVSLLPTVTGERLVMSLPTGASGPPSLSEAGFEQPDFEVLRGLLDAGAGLVLLAGPVGGGRSTTLELLTAELLSADRTVLSIQEQVTRWIDGVWQVELCPGSGLTTTAALAAALRQDADVLTLDELRSAADAHLLLEIASAGTLVVATTIGSDSCDAIARLLAGGVEAHSLASRLSGVVAQRVLRANCTECSAEYRSDLMEDVEYQGVPATRRGEGCEACDQSGSAGHTAIFEVLAVGEGLRRAIERGAPSSDLREAAASDGLKTLLANGLQRVDQGVVTLEELDRAVPFARR